MAILPPKAAESGPGTVACVFPVLVHPRGLPESPGDPSSAEIAHVGPGHFLDPSDILKNVTLIIPNAQLDDAPKDFFLPEFLYFSARKGFPILAEF